MCASPTRPAHAAAPSTFLSHQPLLTSCAGCAHAATTRATADVHANITTLEHGASPAAANAVLNLASLYMSVTVTALHAHTPRVWPPHRQAPAHHVPALPWGTCGARGLTWFERVRDGSTSCVADGATVHVVGHCFDFFWCHLMRERPSAWYDLLPHLQAAAGIAAATAAAAAPRQAATATTAAELLALRPEAIHVALHLRTVKRRRLKNAYYGALVVALRRRHTRHLAATATSALSLSAATRPSATKPELQIWIHTDHDLPPSTNGSGACAGLICGLARTAGVRVVTPGMLGAGRAAAAAPVLVMRQLAAMDLLVPAVSSLSIVPALLSNTSVLFPGNGTCTNRASLPHWHVLCRVTATSSRWSARHRCDAVAAATRSSAVRACGCAGGLGSHGHGT